MIRRKFFTGFFIFVFSWSNFLSAGPTQLTFTYQVTVTNETGSPEGGVAIRLTGYYSVWEYQSDLGYYEWELRSATNEGSTNASGYVSLVASADISEYYPEDYRVEHMLIEMIDPDYSVLSSQNTQSYFTNAAGSFVVVFDLDRDLLNDNIEWQLANKFKPVLHPHSLELEKQQGLHNMDLIINSYGTLKVILTGNSQTAYNNSTPPIHVIDTYGNWDTYAAGEISIISILDISDSQRYLSAPVGQRPLYFHCYKEGGYYYLQYWYFFTMNDIQDQTNYDIYHEGDWEHVSIKIEKNGENFVPKYVNFYQHAGGHTINANNCWWSSTSATTYISLRQGYDENHTHLHIWIAANSHASYNRYEKVYRIHKNIPVFGDEDYIDRVNYGFPLQMPDPYFVYDYLENLGEVKTTSYIKIHNIIWFSHTQALGNSKDWLSFRGFIGGQWFAPACPFGEWCGAQPAPLMPSYNKSASESHEYYSFTHDESEDGFGNEEDGISWEDVQGPPPE